MTQCLQLADMHVQSPKPPGRFGLRLAVYPPSQVSQTDGCLCHLTPAFVLSEVAQTPGPLCSTDIAPRHRSYGPLRHPLHFGRFPGCLGYTAYLAPPLSRREEEGFSSCLARPCPRAVAITPPEWKVVSASVRPSMLPSPYRMRVRPPVPAISGPPMRSLALRPADSLPS